MISIGPPAGPTEGRAGMPVLGANAGRPEFRICGSGVVGFGDFGPDPGFSRQTGPRDAQTVFLSCIRGAATVRRHPAHTGTQGAARCIPVLTFSRCSGGRSVSIGVAGGSIARGDPSPAASTSLTTWRPQLKRIKSQCSLPSSTHASRRARAIVVSCSGLVGRAPATPEKRIPISEAVDHYHSSAAVAGLV